MKHSPLVEMFTSRRIAIIEGDHDSAEMLHTFFRLMELEAYLVKGDEVAVPTLSRLRPDVIALDLDLPNLRSLELARAIRRALPRVPLILMTDEPPKFDAFTGPVIAKPRAKFEELLRMFELVLALGE
ncbi:MAG TPA: response regulator [Longimicrobium sp.]|nr:response regulator [Longimicrobium sp.]